MNFGMESDNKTNKQTNKQTILSSYNYAKTNLQLINFVLGIWAIILHRSELHPKNEEFLKAPSHTHVPLTYKDELALLKTLDTFGNCQRPVFSFGVSQNNKPVKFWTQLVVEVVR